MNPAEFLRARQVSTPSRPIPQGVYMTTIEKICKHCNAKFDASLKEHNTGSEEHFIFGDAKMGKPIPH